MEELNFTWVSAVKILSGILLFGVWFMVKQQARLEKNDCERREQAKAEGKPVPATEQRIGSRSNTIIIAVTIIFLIVALALGNKSTI